MRRLVPYRVRSCSVPSAPLLARSSALRRDHRLRAPSGCIRHRRRLARRSSERRKRVRGPNRNRPALSFHCRHQNPPNRRPTLSRRRTHNRQASPRRANGRRSARRWPATRCRRFRVLNKSSELAASEAFFEQAREISPSKSAPLENLAPPGNSPAQLHHRKHSASRFDAAAARRTREPSCQLPPTTGRAQKILI
jgi:hypothetical protein